MGRSPFPGRSDKDNLESQLASIEAQKLTSRVPFVEGRQRSFVVEQYIGNTTVEKTVEEVTENNYIIQGGGGGGYTTNVIVGTTGAATANPSLPTTVTGRGVVSRAYGSGLVADLTAAGDQQMGVYTGTNFHPLNAVSGAYSLVNTTSTKDRGRGGPLQFPTTDEYSAQYMHDVNNSNYMQYCKPRTAVYVHSKCFCVEHSGNVILLDGSPKTIGGLATPIYNDTTISSYAGYYSGGTPYATPLGSTNTGRAYFTLTKQASFSSYTTSIFYIDVGALYLDWVAAGSSSSLWVNNYLVKVNEYSTATNPFTQSYGLGLECSIAGALSGRNYAWARTNFATLLYRVSLTTGSFTEYTLPVTVESIVETSANYSLTYIGMFAAHIRSQEWGDSVDEFVGIRKVTSGSGYEARICKFGPWGVADLTVAGEGPDYVRRGYTSSYYFPSGIRSPIAVPQSSTDAVFSGGAPTHVSWYADNGSGDADQGVHYVQVSSI